MLDARKDPTIVETFWAEGTPSTKALGRKERGWLQELENGVVEQSDQGKECRGGPEVTQHAHAAWDPAERQGR